MRAKTTTPPPNPHLARLSTRHQHVFRVYLDTGLNAAETARRCGYAESSGANTVKLIVRKEAFQAALQHELEAAISLPSEGAEVSAHALLRVLGAAAIEAKAPGDVVLRDGAWMKAVELLMKYYGLLVDRLEVNDPRGELARLLGVEPDDIPGVVERRGLRVEEDEN